MKTFGMMLGELNEEQIEAILKDLPIGRINCHVERITYCGAFRSEIRSFFYEANIYLDF